MTVSPLSYAVDCFNVCGIVVFHDDSKSERGEGSTLRNGFLETRKLWQKLYNEKYPKEECFYMGPAPEYFWKSDKKQI